MEMLDKGVIYLPGQDEQECENSEQFKTYKLNKIFHLIFSDCGASLATETIESKTTCKGRPL